MAIYLSTELGGSANQTAAPASYRPTAYAYQARLRSMRGTFTLASQTTSDTLVIGDLPVGARFAYGVITSSVTLGSSTIAVGIAGTTAKYKAAATFTTADTPTLFGIAAQVAQAPSAAGERIFATIGAASLPASGTLVIEIFYTMP